jgi:hypothetical protein
VVKRNGLPSPTLAERYRRLAQSCRASALGLGEEYPVERMRLLKMAAAWDRFAQEADRRQGKQSPKPSEPGKRKTMELFDAEKWATLTLAEQTECCLAWAVEAQALAKISPPKVKLLFESIAKNWINLAAELERGTR